MSSRLRPKTVWCGEALGERLQSLSQSKDRILLALESGDFDIQNEVDLWMSSTSVWRGVLFESRLDRDSVKRLTRGAVASLKIAAELLEGVDDWVVRQNGTITPLMSRDRGIFDVAHHVNNTVLQGLFNGDPGVRAMALKAAQRADLLFSMAATVFVNTNGPVRPKKSHSQRHLVVDALIRLGKEWTDEERSRFVQIGLGEVRQETDRNKNREQWRIVEALLDPDGALAEHVDVGDERAQRKRILTDNGNQVAFALAAWLAAPVSDFVKSGRVSHDWWQKCGTSVLVCLDGPQVLDLCQTHPTLNAVPGWSETANRQQLLNVSLGGVLKKGRQL